MNIKLITETVIASIYEEPWKLVVCQKCGRLGAHILRGWFDKERCEDRVVHAVRWPQSGIWQEVDFCPTPLADEQLLMQLLAQPIIEGEQ